MTDRVAGFDSGCDCNFGFGCVSDNLRDRDRGSRAVAVAEVTLRIVVGTHRGLDFGIEIESRNGLGSSRVFCRLRGLEGECEMDL